MNAEKLVMDWLNAAPELKDYPARFPPNPAPRTVSRSSPWNAREVRKAGSCRDH